MLGYWGDEEKTQEVEEKWNGGQKSVQCFFLKVVGRDGWMHTGDTAVITEAGYGKIVGRMKDMVIRGGENIYPRLNLSWNI